MNKFLNGYFFFISIIEAFIELYFFARFIEKKAKWHHYIVFTVFTYCILYLTYPINLLKIILLILLLFIIGVICFQLKFEISILNSLTIIALMQLCYGVFNSITGILSPLLYPINPFLIGLCFAVFNSILALGLAFICYTIISKYFFYYNQEQNKYVLMILTPLFMILIISEYFNYNVYGNTIILDSQNKINGINHIQMFIIQILCIISLFCVIFSYEKLINSFVLSTKLSVLEQETYFQKKYLDEITLRYKQTKAFRHDIKNHLTIIMGLLEKENNKQAKQYLKQLENITVDLSFPCHTNNPIVDILLKNKFSLARSNAIQVSCSLKLPSPCYIHDLDFCIVLSNALDNAIEACKKIKNEIDRYIYVSGCRQGNFFMIDIENSYIPQIYAKKSDHTGLSNIKAVAEKYSGTISIDWKENIFRLSVLFIIPQQSNNILHQND